MNVHEINPLSLYFVDYWIDNEGNKHYQSVVLIGADLTEKQISTCEEIYT